MQARWKPNVTVAAVIERDGRFLLVEEHTNAGLRLNNPAGHLEAGESPEQGVVREVIEETAHEFAPDCVVGFYLARYLRTGTDEDVTYLRLTYGGKAGRPIPGAKLDKGIVAVHWLTRDEIAAQSARLRSALVLRCIDDYIAGQRLSLNVVYTDPSVFNSPPRE